MPKKEIAVQRNREAARRASKSKPQPKKTTAPKKPSKSATAVSETTPSSNSILNAPAKVKPNKILPDAKVVADHNRRTAILLERDVDRVKLVSLDVENGLDLTLADPRSFDERYKPLADYPVEKAAKLYVEYARGLGATEQVMRMLGKLTPVTQEDIEMAAAKKNARAAAPVKTDKKPGKKTAAPAKAATKAATKKEPGEKKEKKPRGPTAASRFQELLMLEGSKKGVAKHTDDQIFAIVKKEFGLQDNKRSYVKWYRNYLEKQGKNPPAAAE